MCTFTACNYVTARAIIERRGFDNPFVSSAVLAFYVGVSVDDRSRCEIGVSLIFLFRVIDVNLLDDLTQVIKCNCFLLSLHKPL